MIIDKENKKILIEPRDINYILPAYVRQYLFYTRGEEIRSIIFPMFQSVPHPDAGTPVPIEWIADTDPIAVSIAEDGKVVPEVTAAEEAEADEKDDRMKEMKEGLAQPVVEEVTVAAEVQSHTKTKHTTSAPLRSPKMPPGGDIGPGVSPSDMGNRDVKLERQIRQDLKDEPGVDESKEVEAIEIEKPKQ